MVGRSLHKLGYSCDTYLDIRVAPIWAPIWHLFGDIRVAPIWAPIWGTYVGIFVWHLFGAPRNVSNRRLQIEGAHIRTDATPVAVMTDEV